MTALELGIGDVRTAADLAVLITQLLDAADGELAAGGQWGRCAAHKSSRQFFADGFTTMVVSVQRATLDKMTLAPLSEAEAGPVLRSFRVSVEPL